MSYEASGKLHAIFDEQQVTEKFRKREFVLEIEDGNYLQYVKFQLTQDRCSLLNDFRKGDMIKVLFNLSGRETKMRDGSIAYFTNLGAWKIERLGSQAQSGASYHTSSTASVDATPPFDVDDDDIPF
ncbi:MAG: DUF3127 domain-containing protein [Bacteroidota bacterium]|nr:DUF3127 domain-containing protein [Candidatus Kapabacteria bacterium]MDW8218949.1 DUF3127 domain-containing protein [Bacteroidota bacterium]